MDEIGESRFIPIGGQTMFYLKTGLLRDITDNTIVGVDLSLTSDPQTNFGQVIGQC